MALRAAPRRGTILAITAGLTALGSLAIHMFVPAMPAAALELNASPSGMQLTLTLYLAAMAIAQFISGPLSDALGRRPLIIASAVFFVLGSCAAWAAADLVTLIAGRIVQAIGGASGLVASRAMAGDKAGDQGTRNLALLMAVAMFSPMLAPLAGAWLSMTLGWHAVFAFLAIAGLVIGSCAIFWLPETRLPPHGRFMLRDVIRDWRMLLAERRFLRNLAIGSSLTAGLYIFLTASPFLLVRLGVAHRHLGFCFAIVAGALAIGALGAGWLAGRVRPAPLVRAVTWSVAVATIILTILAAIGRAGPVELLLTMAIYAFGGGIIAPNAMSGAMAASKGRPGTAVSAYGSIQMAGNALAAGAVVALPSGSVLAFAIALSTTAMLAALLAAWRA